MKMVFRNCEVTEGCGNTTHCPNRWCGSQSAQPATADYASIASEAYRAKANGTRPPSNKVLYSTAVWLYTWPKAPPVGLVGVEKALSAREEALEEKYRKLLERVEALEESAR